MRIDSSIAMNAARNWGFHQNNLSKAVMRVSGGKRINSAMDDPAGIFKQQRLKARLRELDVYIKNTRKQIDDAEAEDDMLQLRQNIYQRMQEIAVQMQSDTYSDEDKTLLLKEYQSLIDELRGNTNQRTGFDTVAVNGGARDGEVFFKNKDQVYYEGSWIAEKDFLKMLNEEQERLQKSDDPDSPSGEKSKSGVTLTSVSEYVSSNISSNLSNFASNGAAINRLNRNLNYLYEQEIQATDELSRHEDADLAAEMLIIVKEQVLAQVSAAMSAQANLQPAKVLYLVNPEKNPMMAT